MESDFVCGICGKKSDEVTVCCSLSEYEKALQNMKVHKTVSLEQFLKMGMGTHWRDAEKLWFVARISTQRDGTGARGEYADISGGYHWMGDALFVTLQLTFGDQYRVHLVVKDPEDENDFYNNL